MGDMGESRAAAIWTGLTVARDSQHHQTGIRTAQNRPAQAPFLHRAWPKVFDQNIGLRHKFEKYLHAFFLAEVDRY